MLLNFTVPGNSNLDLKTGGADIEVNIHNIDEYVDLVLNYFLEAGIRRQMESFIFGFNSIFDISKLETFSETELDLFICGTGDIDSDWSPQILLDNIKFTRGYTAQTPVTKYLIEAITEFDVSQRRNFLRFLTGSPRLPIGGFKNMDPKFTIQRTELSNYVADYYLPTVNTCFLLLKLPEYSCKKVLVEKLLLAMNEGHNSFDLS